MIVPDTQGSTTELPYTQKVDRFSSHARIAAAVIRGSNLNRAAPYVVLDVGCAYGFLRPYLPSPSFYLIGIDINAGAVERARQHYDEVHQANVADSEKLTLRFAPNAIVFGDVLEHLPDPLNSLKLALAQYARPQTQVVVSLPNFAHLYVRLKLLAGQFEYRDRGLFDHTHLRFFTLKTAKQMLEATQLRIVSIDSTPAPLPLIHPVFGPGHTLFPVHIINNALARLWPSLLAYQFILEAHYDA